MCLQKDCGFAIMSAGEEYIRRCEQPCRAMVVFDCESDRGKRMKKVIPGDLTGRSDILSRVIK